LYSIDLCNLNYKPAAVVYDVTRGSMKAAGSRPDELIEPNQFIFLCCALRFTQSLTEISTRSRKIIFLGSRAQLVPEAGNYSVICEPNVFGILDNSQSVGLHSLLR
jgi:hypothetical protein